MKLLFIADPNSIHDVRWINHFGKKEEFSCFILPREFHFINRSLGTSLLDRRVTILQPIKDHSTVRPIRTIRQFLRIRQVIRRFGIQIMHIMYAEPNALWASGSSFFSVPIILTTRGTDVLKTIPGFFSKKDLLSVAVAFQYKAAFKKVAQITSTSQSQVDSLLNLEVDSPISIIRTGIDLEKIDDSSQPNLGELIGKPFVLMPRNMKPIYNHDFTLEAIKLLSDTVKRKYAFIFINSAGESDSYFQSINNKARTIDADIRFLPTFDHAKLLRFYREASLIVMNPKSDGSPVTAMEAMACKVPVILPPLDYDEDVFAEAWFFKDWNPNSLAQGIEQLVLTDKNQLTERLEANFRRIAAYGNTEAEMQKVMDIYRRLLNGTN